MTALAALAVVLFLAALLLWAWRERGRAIQDSKRARQIDSAASDAADLLAASMMSLRLAREMLPAEATGSRTWILEAEGATRAVAGLFESARVYVREESVARARDADGYVRLAVAMARAEGRGVALKGDATEIRCTGAPRDALDLVSDLIEQLWQHAASTRSVTVNLQPTAVVFEAPSAERFDLAAISARARQLGLELAVSTIDGGIAVTLRSTIVSDPPAHDALGQLSAGAARTVH